MRGKGITYDTGFFPGRKNSREHFDPNVVRRELAIIVDDLRCNAVRIAGGEPARLTVAGGHAAAAGLEVWFSPFPCELTPTQMLPYFAECARRAEELRRGGASVVLATGCELSLFAAGFIPGDDAYGRMATLGTAGPELWAALCEVPAQMNAFLAETAATVRRDFGGPVTYAAGIWEEVDWTPFDVVAVDAYRSAEYAATCRIDPTPTPAGTLHPKGGRDDESISSVA